MSARHAPRPEVIYRRGHVGSAEFFTSLYGHGDASMMVYRFGCNGEREGPDFVLVHGIGVSARSYGPTAAVLAQHGDVYLVDLPGYGRSPRPDVDMSIADHARVLADFLADRKLDHPVVVGHSMGTQVVVELAADFPDLLDHMALIAPVLEPDARTLSRAARLLFLNGLREPPVVTLTAINDYLFRAGVGYMIQQTPHLLGMQMENLTSRVTAKTLVICGEQDPIVSLDWGRRLATSFTHGSFVTVPGPHAAMFAAPDLIAGHLDRHAHL